jgi:hypothetical protein
MDHRVNQPLGGIAVASRAEGTMRELEASLQQYGEFILKARLVKEKATIAPCSI